MKIELMEFSRNTVKICILLYVLRRKRQVATYDGIMNHLKLCLTPTKEAIAEGIRAQLIQYVSKGVGRGKKATFTVTSNAIAALEEWPTV